MLATDAPSIGSDNKTFEKKVNITMMALRFVFFLFWSFQSSFLVNWCGEDGNELNKYEAQWANS